MKIKNDCNRYYVAGCVCVQQAADNKRKCTAESIGRNN